MEGHGTDPHAYVTIELNCGIDMKKAWEALLRVRQEGIDEGLEIGKYSLLAGDIDLLVLVKSRDHDKIGDWVQKLRAVRTSNPGEVIIMSTNTRECIGDQP